MHYCLSSIWQRKLAQHFGLFLSVSFCLQGRMRSIADPGTRCNSAELYQIHIMFPVLCMVWGTVQVQQHRELCVLHSASALSSVLWLAVLPRGGLIRVNSLVNEKLLWKWRKIRRSEQQCGLFTLKDCWSMLWSILFCVLLQRVGYSGENMIISWSTLLAEDIPLFISCCQQGAIIAIHEETWGQERGVEDMQLAGQGFVAHSPNGQPGHPETVVSRVVSCCLGWVGRQQFYTERTSPKL